MFTFPINISFFILIRLVFNDFLNKQINDKKLYNVSTFENGSNLKVARIVGCLLFAIVDFITNN